jgi:hypothetical protein
MTDPDKSLSVVVCSLYFQNKFTWPNSLWPHTFKHGVVGVWERGKGVLEITLKRRDTNKSINSILSKKISEKTEDNVLSSIKIYNQTIIFR